MKKIWNWILNNPNRAMFLVPILLVAGISISHVVTWYDMANPINWAVYLSIAIEVGAMTALVAATNKIKGGVWFMFGLVTFIQMIGNIFYSFYQIDESGDLFQAWIELTAPVWELMGTETTDIVGMKRWLAFLEGGLLPLISLTSLHFFVTYEKNEEEVSKTTEPKEELNKTESTKIRFEQNGSSLNEYHSVSDMSKDLVKGHKKNGGNDLEKIIKSKDIVESFGGKFDIDTETLELSDEEINTINESVETTSNNEVVYDEKNEVDEWDEDHALDMVMNEMVEDLMEEESVDTIEELVEVLEDEPSKEETDNEKKEADKPITKQDVTVSNKNTKRKMGINRIR